MNTVHSVPLAAGASPLRSVSAPRKPAPATAHTQPGARK